MNQGSFLRLYLLSDVNEQAVGEAELRQTVAKQTGEEGKHLVIELHGNLTCEAEADIVYTDHGGIPFFLAIEGILSFMTFG